jgi:serine/threonine-protein kinase
MELVDGPTLADRIAEGPLRVGDAIAIAIQIAEALEAAHDQGIIHRDLKPANIKVQPDGRVKVLDFGLAKTMEAAVTPSVVGQLATVTSPAMTEAGVVLGTAAYMSPEQARGQPLDKRSDIWSFGCILFEMLTGRVVFAGHTVSDTIAALLEREPDWTALPPAAQPVAGMLRRCLEKDRANRLRDIGDVKQWLDATRTPVAAAPAVQTSARHSAWGIATAAVLGIVVGATAIGTVLRNRNQIISYPVARFALTASQGDAFNADTFGNNVAISPDGSRLVYTADRDGTPQLFVHHLDSFAAEPIAGTDGGTFPFFSPDGKQIGFATLDDLKRVPVEGGAGVSICPVDAGFRGAAWAGDGTIVFAKDGGVGLLRVSASGGVPQKIAAPDPAKNEENYVHPTLITGSDTVLYTVLLAGGHSRVAARKLSGGAAVTVAEGGFGSQYVRPGFVVFGQDDRLMAIRFDPSTLEVGSSPVAVQANVFTKVTDAVANVTISLDGTVAYVAGHNIGSRRRVVWVNRQGAHGAAVIEQPLEYARNPRLSPDGRRLALTVGTSGHADIWIYDLDGANAGLRLTHQNHNTFPIWSPDGQRIVYLSIASMGGYMYSIPADGSVLEPERLISSGDGPEVPLTFSPDGKYVLFRKNDDIWMLDLAERKARPWFPTPFNEHASAFSPDGKWVAYSSDGTGRLEIWARPFPGAGAPVRVSSEGGHDPVWSRDGNEILFENAGKLISARIRSDTSGLRVEPPRILFEGGFAHDDTDPGLRLFDAAPDGRLIMIEPIGVSTPPSIAVVQHFDQELGRLVPAK